MSVLSAIAGAYAVGGWVAASIVAARWLANRSTTIAGFLTIAGWAAVAKACFAIVATAA